ncbi:serine hydrolase [Flavobacteriaceae bacterium KMM 6898]|nr:serine hydrolase [Flavobacteriaceae bacterium KMM 6898]
MSWKKHLAIFSVLTILLVYGCFVVKSEYFNHPYPNIIEYIASIFLLAYTIILLFWKKNRKKKVMLGGSFIVILMISINVLNYFNEWHPVGLNLPFNSSQSFRINHEPYEWPQGKPEEIYNDTVKLNKYYSKIEKWHRLRGLLVVQDDKLIIEKYFDGANLYDAYNVHSVTKSITSALVGIAIDKGIIPSEEEKVMKYFLEYQNQVDSLKNVITLKHLLTMKGGFAHWDAYSTPKECIVDIDINKTPGTNFKYFTGSQALLSAIITKSSKQTTKDFAREHFLEPIGVKNGFWRLQDGYYCGGGESYYTARDLARIGQVYLNKGKVNSKQIVSEEWIEKSFTNYTESSNDFRTLDDYIEVGYGYCWWLLDYQGHKIYTARGKGGQYLMVIPEINAVVVIIQEWNLKKEFEMENNLLCDLLAILLNNTKNSAPQRIL